MIELSERTWVRGVWVADLPLAHSDLMGALLKEEDGVWRFRARIRIHRDEHVFGSDDDKFWMAFNYGASLSKEAMQEITAHVSAVAKEGGDGKVTFIELDCRGDDAKVHRVLMKYPWFYSKRIDK
jgi:hypothetical protein